MASRFVAAVLLICASQANAACHLPPPPCVFGAPAPSSSLAALLPNLLGSFASPLPALAPLGLPSFLPSPLRPFPLPSFPGTIPCPVPPTQVSNKPDVNIPLPLPAEIPVGKFCTCQKFAIRPALVPCAPTAQPAVLPQLAPLSFLPQSSSPAVLSPAVLQSLLGSLAPGLPAPCTCV